MGPKLSLLDHTVQSGRKWLVSIREARLYRSLAARSHQVLISAASMLSPFDPSIKRTFRPQAGFL
jgi:hypothetical protein